MTAKRPHPLALPPQVEIRRGMMPQMAPAYSKKRGNVTTKEETATAKLPNIENGAKLEFRFDPSVDISKLSPSVLATVQEAIKRWEKGGLKGVPYTSVHGLGGLWKQRIGGLRCIVRYEGNVGIIIFIAHRGSVYEKYLR